MQHDNLNRLLATAVASAATFSIPAALRAGPTTNPSFPITRDEATAALRTIAAAQPTKLERPVVILGGFMDVGVGPNAYARALAKVVDGQIVTVSFADCPTFEACRQRVAEVVTQRLGQGPDGETVEVDVVGQSMGGLVAMFSALHDPTLGPRLNVRRLFTISSPLQGAVRAAVQPAFADAFPLVRDMRPGSALYRRLAGAAIDYPLFSYTRLDDETVGERFAAAPGHGVWWVDNPPGERAHLGVFNDPRVVSTSSAGCATSRPSPPSRPPRSPPPGPPDESEDGAADE